MIKIENVDIFGWDAAIRGMRNPMNSWDKSDSYWTHIEDAETLETAPFEFFGGEADLKLMKTLSKAGSDHGKFLRMINVTLDITAPLYWWKEFDTYKVGTVANSCSTMHKIQAKEFTFDDFSIEHLDDESIAIFGDILDSLNNARDIFVNGYTAKHYTIAKGNKDYWWQMIQLLPSSYNQKRTVQLNYQVLKSMYKSRWCHKLDEWVYFCEWMHSLPYFKEICLEE